MPDQDPKSVFAELLTGSAPPLPSREQVLTGARQRLRRRRATMAACTAGLASLALIAGAATAFTPGGPGHGSAAAMSPTASEAARASRPAVSKSPFIRSRPTGGAIPPEQRQRADKLHAALVAVLPTGVTTSDEDIVTLSIAGWQANGWHYGVGIKVHRDGKPAVLRVDAFSDYGALADGCAGTRQLAGEVSADVCREYTAADGSRVGVISRNGSELYAAWGNGDVAVGIAQLRGTAIMRTSPSGVLGVPKPPDDDSSPRLFDEQQLADLVVDPSFRP